MRTYAKVILDIDKVMKVIDYERNIHFGGQKIVFTNGCFDILHMGHVHILEKAKNLGDFLIVGINSDASVRRIKSDKRPIIPQDQRAYMLAALECVNLVTIFDDDDPFTLIYAIKPDILVKGGDWDLKNIVGYDIVKANGGEVHVINHEVQTSSTKVIEKILSNYKES